MNNAKKVIKNPSQKNKNPRILKQKSYKVWLIAAVALVIILIPIIVYDQLYKGIILTIDGDKYYMKDLNYYFYSVESRYEYYDQALGGTYWDMAYDETSGQTIRDMAKQEAIDTSIYNEILYREAISNGYTLTEEEKETVETTVTSMLDSQLSDAVILRNNFKKKSLIKVINKITLANRYRQEVIDTFEIDDEAIQAEIDYNEFRQYDIEYLFISTQTADEEDNIVNMSATEKVEAYDKINSLYTSALDIEDWSTLIPEDEEDVSYKETSFLESDTTFTDDLETMMMSMANNTISNILEDEKGYYIIRMIDNNSSESYDSEVENTIQAVENEEFSKYYDEILERYDYSVNEKALSKLTMGEITIAN